jgi:hypothetical protein
MSDQELSSIRNPGEDQRDKSLFRVGQRVAVNLGGCVENRTEGVIHAVRQLPTLTTYELRLDGYDSYAGVDTVYMAEALTPLD